VTISGLILITAHVLLMFIIRTVRLLEISCCLSHLVCQLALIKFQTLYFLLGMASEARIDKIAKNIEFVILKEI
jgi:hypothetical protein